MKIETSLSITIEEQDLKDAVIRLIKEHNPNIVVDDIDFVARRNPKSIETSVTARITDGAVSAETKPQPKVSNKTVDMVDELDEAEKKAEPAKKQKAEQSKPAKAKEEPVDPEVQQDEEEGELSIDDLLGDDEDESFEDSEMKLINETLEEEEEDLDLDTNSTEQEDAKNSGGSSSLEDFLDTI